MLDGYASNLGRCVTIAYGKFFEIKSHDCHVFIECLLPVALRELCNAPILEKEKKEGGRTTQHD